MSSPPARRSGARGLCSPGTLEGGRSEQLERDLAEAVEQQTAARAVLEVIGRSTASLEPVFETVLQQAVRLCRADAGLIYVLDGELCRVAFAIGGSQEYRDYVGGIPLSHGAGTLVGRVASSSARCRSSTCSPIRTTSFIAHGFRTMCGDAHRWHGRRR